MKMLFFLIYSSLYKTQNEFINVCSEAIKCEVYVTYVIKE